MTTKQAMQALIDGKSIISNWDRRPVKIIDGEIKYVDGDYVAINGFLNAPDMRVYEEPKKKIEVARYRYFTSGRWHSTVTYYKNDEDFIEETRTLPFKRLDGTDGTQDTTELVDEY